MGCVTTISNGMNFNLRGAQIYKAVIFYKLFPKRLLVFYKILFFVLGLLPFVISILNSAIEYQINMGLGWSFIFLPLAFSVLFFELFGNYYLRYPKIKSTDPRSADRVSPEALAVAQGYGEASNIAEFIEFELADIFNNTLTLSMRAGEEALSVRTFASVLISDDGVAKVLRRAIPNFSVLVNQLSQSLKVNSAPSLRISALSRQNISPEVMKMLEEAIAVKDRHGGYRISVLDMLAVMFDYNDEFRQFVISQDLDRNDLEELADWYEHIWTFWRENNKFWSLDNLLRQPPIGREWVFGYARYLKSFAVNITDKMEFSKPSLRLMIRAREIEQIEQVLARSGENNVLLVGEEGVGKETIIMDFAEMIAKGKALPQLNYKKVFDLNLALVAGSSKDITDVQNILVSILNESVKTGNVILILRNFHDFIGEISGMGRIDVSEILVPYLKSGSIQVIATTNPSSFHKYIENRSELTDVFERINIFEPNRVETMEIIEEAIPGLEAKSGVLVTYGAIKEVVDGADKFIRTAPFPEKAFDLLSETVSYVVAQKRKIILRQDVDEVISRKTGVPLGPIVGEEKDKLANLEELMHEDIVGQDRAVEVIASTMRRLRTGLAKRGKPAGVFLFVGPTGVGKTLTAKILAKTYFGSKDRMLRFDMSEYQELESLDRFLGSTRTNEPGQFVTMARDNPFSLILLDELEKADKNILNIFLQVFDEGHLTDVFGRKVGFEQNIIIATSNAAAAFIRELVQQGMDPSLEKERVVDALIKGKYFSPEFLNRFDEIVIFHPLSQDQVGKITGLLMESLARRLKEQGYIFKPTQDVADYVAKAGFDPQFGARPMERVIRDKVENLIAKKILEGSIKKGREFSLSAEALK